MNNTRWGQNKERVDDAKGRGRHDSEINREGLVQMIARERSPSLPGTCLLEPRSAANHFFEREASMTLCACFTVSKPLSTSACKIFAGSAMIPYGPTITPEGFS